MRIAAIALVLLAPCAVALAVAACTSSDNRSPANATGNDASTADAAKPFDGSQPGVDANVGDDANDDGSTDAALSCSDWDAAVEGVAQDGSLAVNADGGGSIPGPYPSTCSITADAHAPLHVVNNAPCPIDMWWVDYNCQEEFFGTADPNGGTFDNDTWETHPWRIRLQGSEELLEEIPALPADSLDAAVRNITYP